MVKTDPDRRTHAPNDANMHVSTHICTLPEIKFQISYLLIAGWMQYYPKCLYRV